VPLGFPNTLQALALTLIQTCFSRAAMTATNSLGCLFPGFTYIFPVMPYLLELLLPEYYVLVPATPVI
jgi:hypothetical protein